jgi:hypothetical protein
VPKQRADSSSAWREIRRKQRSTLTAAPLGDTMLRYKDSIRLNVLDRQLYARVAQTQRDAPTTVRDYNHRLEAAARMWSGGATPGELILAQMARDLMLDPVDPADVLGERQLAKPHFS